jgi:hypothetical protein
MSGYVAEMVISSQFGAMNQRGRRLDLINAVFGAAAFITFQFAMSIGLLVMSWFCLRGWITIGEIVCTTDQAFPGTGLISWRVERRSGADIGGRPVRVKKFAAWSIKALVRVSTEVITLCLQQVCRQARVAIGIEIG